MVKIYNFQWFFDCVRLKIDRSDKFLQSDVMRSRCINWRWFVCWSILYPPLLSLLIYLLLPLHLVSVSFILFLLAYLYKLRVWFLLPPFVFVCFFIHILFYLFFLYFPFFSLSFVDIFNHYLVLLLFTASPILYIAY